MRRREVGEGETLYGECGVRWGQGAWGSEWQMLPDTAVTCAVLADKSVKVVGEKDNDTKSQNLYGPDLKRVNNLSDL